MITRTISGKYVDILFPSWTPLKRSLSSSAFLAKLDARRAKNRIANKSRKVNR